MSRFCYLLFSKILHIFAKNGVFISKKSYRRYGKESYKVDRGRIA